VARPLKADREPTQQNEIRTAGRKITRKEHITDRKGRVALFIGDMDARSERGVKGRRRVL